jgi:hypothetical protein
VRQEADAMLVQLNPPLPLETPKGAGWAHFVIDYGPESALSSPSPSSAVTLAGPAPARARL